MLSVATLVAETNGFTGFDNQRQLVSYAGYDVVENQSGKRVGKTRISKKGGNSKVKSHPTNITLASLECGALPGTHL